MPLTINLNNVQPLDTDLTAIAGLSPSNDDFIQRKAGAWTNRTVAQVRSDLNITAQYWWASASTPTIADSTTYRVSVIPAIVLGTADSLNNQISSEYTGTVTSARINWNMAAGSNEAVTFRIKNLTTGNTWDASTALDWSVGAGAQNFTGGTLVVSVGDKLQAIIITPAFATNPTSASVSVSISITL